MKSIAIKVQLKKAEIIRKKLFQQNLINKNCKIKRDINFLYIPITKPINIEGTEVIEENFEIKMKQPKSYKHLVDIPNNLIHLLPTSFDNIGKITILKLPEELLPYSKKIGEAHLNWKNVKSVAIDRGVKGDSRIRDLKIIAGSKKTVTIHKENGLFFKTDILKVYFSPRLATERERIKNQINKGEIIIDMFSGIGPFSILISKKSLAKKIYAIDKNNEAIKYLKENIKINKVSNIVPICGDAKVIINDIEKSDRIIMNLPHSSFDYLQYALKGIKNFGFIHYYEILEQEKIDNRINQINEKMQKNNYKIDGNK